MLTPMNRFDVGLSGWKNVLVRLVQLAIFAWFMPPLFRHTSDIWSFNARMIMAALWAGACAWVLGLLLAALLEYLFGEAHR